MVILNKIISATKERIEEDKKNQSIRDLEREIQNIKIADEETEKEENKRKFFKEDFCFEKALKNDDISFICEVKKASPSKGILTNNFSHIEIALEYEAAGANAISVLTEPNFFQGKDNYLKEIATVVDIPVLRKDFIIDEYQIYQSKVLGADAILLISTLLKSDELKHFIEVADSLGLSSLVETHTEDEIISANKAGARIIGVNNRDLRTFNVDINTSVRLRPFIQKDKIFVSESGFSTYEHINKLRRIKADAVLIGEALIRRGDKKRALKELKGKIG